MSNPWEEQDSLPWAESDGAMPWEEGGKSVSIKDIDQSAFTLPQETQPYLRTPSDQPLNRGPGQYIEGIMHGIGQGASAVGNYLLDPKHGWVNQLLQATGREGWPDKDAMVPQFGSDVLVPKYPKMFNAGESLLKLPKSEMDVLEPHPMKEVLRGLSEGLTTPESLATLPFAASKLPLAFRAAPLLESGIVGLPQISHALPISPLISKPIQALYLAQSAPATVEGVGKALDTSLPNEAREQGGIEAGLNTLFSGLLAHGLIKGTGQPGISIPEVLPQLEPNPVPYQPRLESPVIDVASEKVGEEPSANDAASLATQRKMIAEAAQDSPRNLGSPISEAKVSIPGLDIKEWSPEGMKPHYQVTDPAGITVYVPKEGTTVESIKEALGKKQEEFTRGDSAKVYGGLPFLDPDFWKSTLGIKEGVKADAMQLYNRIRNRLGDKSSTWEMLNNEDFKGFISGGKKSPEEVAKWVEENGPRVEVKKFGQSQQTPERKEFAQLQHDFDSVGNPEVISRYAKMTREGENLDPKAYGLTEEIDKKIRRFIELEKSPQTWSEASNSHWQTIAPKPESSMPEYTEIAVVKPPKQVSVAQFGNKSEMMNEKPQFPGSHSFPPNTLGFARGYMETLPNGKKVWHVIEVQSDWAQKNREMSEKYKNEPNQDTASRYIERHAPNDPLLSHYERLLLKASIEHARSQGADAIAVSDAETAMMTEGHDHNLTKYNYGGQGFPSKEAALNYTRTAQDKVKHFGNGEEKPRFEPIQESNGTWSLQQIPSHFEGMRLHYSPETGTLHRIARELTGSEGEKVGFGEHKMAKTTESGSGANYEMPGGYRQDLIFRNPDNTPKTNVTAVMYPLEGAKKQFTLTGKDKATPPKAKVSEGESTKLYGGIPFLDPDYWKSEYGKWKSYLKSGITKERAAQLLDAADNKAKLLARQYGNRIRQALPNELDRRALTFIIEAGDDKSILHLFRVQAKDDKKAVVAITHAIANWNRLKPHADEAVNIMNGQRTREQSAGIDTDHVENYIKHAYDFSRGILFDGGKGGSGVGASFKKQRTYANYASAIEQGLKPSTLDAANLVESRLSAGSKMVNRIEWAKQLKGLIDPESREPVATSLVRQPKGTMVAVKGYTPREILPGIRLGIKDEYTGLFDAITGQSVVANSMVGRGVLKAESFVKHGMLMFDTFHASRMLQKKAFLTGRPTYAKGHSLLEYDLPTIRRMVANGDITPEIGKWLVANKPTANLLIRNGLNVGRITDALYSDVIRKQLKILGVDINVPGRFNRWVFDKVTRGAMMEAALTEFERTKKANSSWSEEQVAGHVAKQINVFFGNLGRQGIFKSVTARDTLQIVALAPQWVEGMMQTEVRAVKQGVEAPFKRKVGTAFKGTATGILAYVIATQLVNMYFRGQPTWDNKEKDHKFDAWIPDPTGKTPGFWISPLSVAAEVTHDALRYHNQGKNALEVASQIAGNKMSPVARSVKTLVGGRDYAGNKILDMNERLRQSGKAILPLPLPAAGLTSDTPGANVRQMFGSLGLKLEPASQREEDTTRMAEMSLQERRNAQKDLNQNKVPLSIQSRYAIAQRATDRQFKREEDLTNKLSPEVRQWTADNKLQVRSFDPEFSQNKVKLKLTNEEEGRLLDLIAEQYNEKLTYLSQQEGVTQKRLDNNLSSARRRALIEFKREYRETH